MIIFKLAILAALACSLARSVGGRWLRARRIAKAPYAVYWPIEGISLFSPSDVHERLNWDLRDLACRGTILSAQIVVLTTHVAADGSVERKKYLMAVVKPY